MAIMMISSELPEILKLSDRVMIMHEGELMGTVVNDKLEEKDIMSIAFNKEVAGPGRAASDSMDSDRG